MIFDFLKYLQPTHYFGLKTRNGDFVFPKVELIDNHKFEKDKNYKSELAKEYDQSWRAIQNGYINYTECITDIKKIPVLDNYVFSRKYFSKVWVLYVLILRVLSFKNPFEELSGFYKSRNVRRYQFASEIIEYSTYKTYQSKLIENQPLVSVIIPTLNRYQYLKDVLKDLEQQDYTNFEIIIIDQSTPFKVEFYKNFSLNIRAEHQEEKALWLARNKAIKQSKGEYLLLFDDDSRIESDWISQHIKALNFFDANISSGVSISKIGAEVPAHYGYFKISDQLDTGNVLIKKEVFEKLGLFDRQFEKQRMGDGEFGLRAYINGFKNISNPYAKRLHLKVETGGLREMGSWDAFRTKKWLDPRPIPSVLYFFRKYFGNNAARYALLRTVPISIMPYQLKKNKLMLILGAIVSILILPIISIQVFKSWRLSSKKLKEGELIDRLN